MKSLEKTVQTLIINGTLTECPGLFYGKTGIAVFFFHYARNTGSELFRRYAFDLIEEIQNQMTVTVSAQYDTGLSGIGVGFEYFLQNGFIEADDDLFEDFDARMYRIAMYDPYPDLSLAVGLTGWGRYFIYRLRGNGQMNSRINKALTHIANEITQKVIEQTVPEGEQPDVFRFFCDLIILPDYSKKYADTLKRCREWECICKPDIPKLFPYLNDLQRLYICQNYFRMDLSEEIEKEWAKRIEPDKNSLLNMGLLKGRSAEGMLQLTTLNTDINWMNLL